ncbi:Eco57I restriction-modification methylase domain-containing protein [Sphingomonas sp. CCH9-E2]|uniref:Eco57I restriction-modification methylase domain-containing protein n=3 Tax=unclassified Sphingomonas TaxID=196159 RepID=UPI0008295638|nr:SAM-dependent methyltransferase [Sphingomonas sp. CCH9-E2]
MNFAPPLRDRASIRLTGAVYTPIEVASAVTSQIRHLVRALRPAILEPSIGDGAFVDSLALHFPGASLTGVDIDAGVISALDLSAGLWPGETAFHASDFLAFACDRIASNGDRFDLVIGNPPFIRKHNYSDEFKENLETLAGLIKYPLPQLKNSWAAFLAASTRLLADCGVAAFVIPYELMTVAYGQQALLWLCAEFPRIDLFISDQKAFPALDQDAIIFVGQKQPAAPEGLFIQRVVDMADLGAAQEHALEIAGEESLALELNRFLIPPATLPLIQRLQRESPKIFDYCTSAPGIVTAANDFFILTEARAKELQLLEFTLPILKKGSFASRLPIFSASDFAAIAEHEPCRFLRLKGKRSELPAEVEAYLLAGEERGFHKRYKCRNRGNWYEVPLVPRADGFVFKRSHEYPRMCLNAADVYITDTAYGLKVREGYSMRGICFSFYNSLTLLFSEMGGRFYGGGVLELSPNEFRALPLIYHEPSDAEFEAFLAAHSGAAGVSSILDFGDRWLGEKLALDEADLRSLRNAWSSVRSHRLRHGKSI